MNNRMMKKITIVVASGCLSLIAGVLQAAQLIPFKNGEAADADAVNANFTELATRINTIGLTAGPMGPQGPAGPAGSVGAAGPAGVAGPTGAQGPKGADGAAGVQGPKGDTGATGSQGIQGPAGTSGTGASTYSWVGSGSSTYAQKVFVVSGTNGRWDREVRAFTRTNNGDGTGTTDMVRQRTLTSQGTVTLIKHDIIHFEWSTTGDIAFTRIERYDTDTTTLQSTQTISPPIAIRTNAMGLGMRWGSASEVTQTFADQTTADSVTYVVDSASLLAIEDIIVKGVAYTGCQKIEVIRSGEALGRQFQKISWYCPDNVGLVKSIMLRTNGSGGLNSRVMELDATESSIAAD